MGVQEQQQAVTTGSRGGGENDNARGRSRVLAAEYAHMRDSRLQERIGGDSGRGRATLQQETGAKCSRRPVARTTIGR